MEVRVGHIIWQSLRIELKGGDVVQVAGGGGEPGFNSSIQISSNLNYYCQTLSLIKMQATIWIQYNLELKPPILLGNLAVISSYN